MNWASESHPAEKAVDVAAAAIFAAAVAFAVPTLAPGFDPATPLAAAAAFLLAYAGLRHVPKDERNYALPAIRPAPIERVREVQAETRDELLLHDRLASVDPDARVVRLFDPSRMAGASSPGSSKAGASIGKQRHSSRSIPAPPDASQALSNALAELRRSLH